MSPRFRLRFLLQEFDLAGSEVFLGRSPDCHITIDDPLVSRQHAKVELRDAKALIRDLDSRNGVRVNGRLIKGETELKDGDRIRIGTQELVFSVAVPTGRLARATGYMKVCASCGNPYPENAPGCPKCGAPAAEEDTLTGLDDTGKSWSFPLLKEVIEKSLSTGRASDAERLMRRAAKEFDTVMPGCDPDSVRSVGVYAIKLGRLVGGSEWIEWALSTHLRHQVPLSLEEAEVLTKLDVRSFPEVPKAVEYFLVNGPIQPKEVTQILAKFQSAHQ